MAAAGGGCQRITLVRVPARSQTVAETIDQDGGSRAERNRSRTIPLLKTSILPPGRPQRQQTATLPEVLHLDHPD